MSSADTTRLSTVAGSVLVLGARGMLGGDTVRALAPRTTVFESDLHDLDITDAAAVRHRLEQLRPAVVINCAAMADVDGCERDPDRANLVNGKAAGSVAVACGTIGACCVHISTDYVFDGAKDGPYAETDPVSPISAYSASKVLGEERVRAATDDHLIVRVAWIYGAHDRSFVRTVLRWARERDVVPVIHDQRGAPTWSLDIVRGIEHLLFARARGTFHLTSAGLCTRYEFAREIFRLRGLDPERLRPISSSELNWLARRPRRLELSTQKYTEVTGQRRRHWSEALAEHLEQEAV